jgi:hypothetical protein
MSLELELWSEGTIEWALSWAIGPQWVVPGPVLKIAASGYFFYTELHPDGTVTERNIDRWDEAWSGDWRKTDDELEIVVGQWRLTVPVGSHRGLEVYGEETEAQPFLVLPIVEPDAAPASGQRIGAVKFVSGGPHLGELHPGGILREYNLLSGWGIGDWHGRWTLSDDRLMLDVGGYHWEEAERPAPGYRVGREQAADSYQDFPVVSVTLVPAQLRLPTDRTGDVATDPVFVFDGYEFSEMSERSDGYFASMLQARRRSAAGGVQTFAAKCIRGDEENAAVARREIAIAEEVSATDGLIAAFSSFELPDEPEFGVYRGALVCLLERGDTDLARHLHSVGPLGVSETLRVVCDLAGALEALHSKFGLVHSDVRPANVIGRRTGQRLSWRLADFSTASRVDPRTGTAPFLGTSEICIPPRAELRLPPPGAATPQLAYIRPADDIWALGILIVQCAIGTVLDSSQRIDADRAAELIEAVPEPLRPLAAGALQTEESARWSAARMRSEAVVAITASERAIGRGGDESDGE